MGIILFPTLNFFFYFFYNNLVLQKFVEKGAVTLAKHSFTPEMVKKGQKAIITVLRQVHVDNSCCAISVFPFDEMSCKIGTFETFCMKKFNQREIPPTACN